MSEQINDKQKEIIRKMVVAMKKKGNGIDHIQNYIDLLVHNKIATISKEDISEIIREVSNQKTDTSFIKTAQKAFQSLEPIQYIIQSLIPEASVNIWFGQFGTKKTFSALSAAVCVALGKNWIGLQTIKSPVLIIDEESGERRLLKRLHDAIIGEYGNENIDINYSSLEQFNLLKSSDDTQKLKDAIINTHSRLVFIDALADIMLGGDENNVKDTQPVFMALRKIAEETKAAIVIIHHTNKNDGYRGSSAIPGAVDTMLKIDSKVGSNALNFSSIKNRDGEPVNLSATIHFDQDAFYLVNELPEALEENKENCEEAILAYAKSNNNELVITEYLVTVPEQEQKKHRNKINALAKRKVLIKDPLKSTHFRAVYSLAA